MTIHFKLNKRKMSKEKLSAARKILAELWQFMVLGRVFDLIAYGP
jgi:hypothetical protein